MAGSKKQKLKKPLPTQSLAPSPIVDEANDTLIDDLIAQLESKASDAQSESHNETRDTNQAEAGGKQGAKGRFKARQVRYALCNS
jgi:OTU domain-containing protein 6